MKDRFKFRAWCEFTIDRRRKYAWKKAKELCPVDSLRHKYTFDRAYDLNHKLIDRYLKKWDKNNKEEDRYVYIKKFSQDVTIDGNGMLGIPYDCKIIKIHLCTGLKDKNGKLIFEGDILKEEIEGETVYESVKYSDCYCTFYLDRDLNFHKSLASKLEVAGNIYENPEFLEEQND